MIYEQIVMRSNICLFQDINDEIPRFRSSLYVAEISENAQKNTPVTWLGGDTVAEVTQGSFWIDMTWYVVARWRYDPTHYYVRIAIQECW